jgi:hypothetical protein
MSETTPRPDDGVIPPADGSVPPPPGYQPGPPPAPAYDPGAVTAAYGSVDPNNPGGYPPPPPTYGGPPQAGVSPYGAPPAGGYGAQPGAAPGYPGAAPAGGWAAAPPPGQPGYGTPGYGAPGYGAPGYGIYGDPYAAPPKTNGLAIAALVLGISGFFCGITGIVAVVLGIVALNQIRSGRGTGRGLAIGGIVTGSIATAFLAVTIVLAATGFWSAFEDAGSTTNDGSTSTDDWWSDDSDLQTDYQLAQGYLAGDCLSVYSEYWDMSDADITDCAQAHGMEVISTFQLSAAITSSDDDLLYEADDACWSQITTLVPDTATQDALDSDIYFPSQEQWDAGERTAYCMVVPYAADQLEAGSVTAGTYGGTGAL